MNFNCYAVFKEDINSDMLDQMSVWMTLAECLKFIEKSDTPKEELFILMQVDYE